MASAKQVRIIIIVYFIFKIGVGMFSIMGWGPNLQIFQKLLLYQKITISYMHIYDFNFIMETAPCETDPFKPALV